MQNTFVAQVEDLELVLSCHKPPHDVDLRQRLRDRIEAVNCYFIRRGREVAGYIVMEYSFFDLGFITMVYTVPGWRRQGIASLLIQYAEKLCRTEKIFISTNRSNQPMRSLLNKLDYTYSGEVDNLDEGDPEHFFCRRLSVDKSRKLAV